MLEADALVIGPNGQVTKLRTVKARWWYFVVCWCAVKKASDEVVEHHHKHLDGLLKVFKESWDGADKAVRVPPTLTVPTMPTEPFKHQATLPASSVSDGMTLSPVLERLCGLGRHRQRGCDADGVVRTVPQVLKALRP